MCSVLNGSVLYWSQGISYLWCIHTTECVYIYIYIHIYIYILNSGPTMFNALNYNIEQR